MYEKICTTHDEVEALMRFWSKNLKAPILPPDACREYAEADILKDKYEVQADIPFEVTPEAGIEVRWEPGGIFTDIVSKRTWNSKAGMDAEHDSCLAYAAPADENPGQNDFADALVSAYCVHLQFGLPVLVSISHGPLQTV